MAKNILVFADGTGNEGGLLPDESRTNVYKLYRATRTGPESIIDPGKVALARQMSFWRRRRVSREPGQRPHTTEPIVFAAPVALVLAPRRPVQRRMSGNRL